MCLITNQLEPLIAQEDMIVYKAINKELKSPYEGFQYSLNKLYITDINEAASNRRCFYDYVDQEIIDKIYPDWRHYWPSDLKCFAEGFHSALTKERLHGEDVIWECTIPEGSEYFTEPTGLVVSNQIIVNRML